MSCADAKDAESILIHCASIVRWGPGHDKILHEVNVVGTQNLLEAAVAHHIRGFIYISSIDAVFDGTHVVNATEDRVPIAKKPVGKYWYEVLQLEYTSSTFISIGTQQLTYLFEHSATKGMAEQMVLDYNGKQGLATCALRPSTTNSNIYYYVAIYILTIS